MKLTRNYKYIENREEFLEVPPHLYDRWLAEGNSANFADLGVVSDFWYFLVENDVETTTHDFDGWYGNPIGEEFDVTIGVENA